MEHLAAKEPDISLRRWWRAKQSEKEKENAGLTRLQMNSNIATCLLDV